MRKGMKVVRPKKTKALTTVWPGYLFDVTVRDALDFDIKRRSTGKSETVSFLPGTQAAVSDAENDALGDAGGFLAAR